MAPVCWASTCHGTMFEWCSISVATIASPFDEGAAVGVRDQVQALGRLAHEDHLAAVIGVHEAGHDVASALVALGGDGAEVIDAAIDVGV